MKTTIISKLLFFCLSTALFIACGKDDSEHFKVTNDTSTQHVLDEQLLVVSQADTTITLHLNATDSVWKAKGRGRRS